MVEVVAAVIEACRTQLGKAGVPGGECGCVEVPGGGKLRVGAEQRERRGAYSAPAGHGFVQGKQGRGRPAVARVGADAQAAVGVARQRVPGDEFRPFGGQARIVALQACGERFRAGVAAKAWERFVFAAHGIEPPRAALWRALRRFGPKHQTFKQCEVGDPFRADAGVQAGDDAAQAVADERGRPVRTERLEQGVEVGQVVREPVGAVVVCAAPEATPIRREDAPVLRQRVDDELE